MTISETPGHWQADCGASCLGFVFFKKGFQQYGTPLMFQHIVYSNNKSRRTLLCPTWLADKLKFRGEIEERTDILKQEKRPRLPPFVNVVLVE